jgi:hypothetical protein
VVLDMLDGSVAIASLTNEVPCVATSHWVHGSIIQIGASSGSDDAWTFFI